MLSDARRRLAVWGDPIAHSRSPELHAAAYRALGREWTYERRRVDAGGFAIALAERDATWRGLSLTFPLKAAAFAAAEARDRPAELTGAVNTLLFGPAALRGFNTDVGGIVGALREQGIAEVGDARIVGAGATATSALLGLVELGARRVEVVARSPERAAPLELLGARVGATVVTRTLTSPSPARPTVTIATLPGGVSVDAATADDLAAGGGLLLDVVYGGRPTALADAWRRAGHRAVDGRGMLLHQALLQVRVFVHGDPDEPLPREAEVLAQMRAVVMGD